MDPARLLFPALRCRPGSGFAHAEALIEQALEFGVGGFILFGGTARGVAGLTADLRRRSRHPLLIGADLERGAGQQFEGATPLPPHAALGQLDDPGTIRRAAALTAREAAALGVNWVYAPVADLDVEPANPIVGTRAFGADPHRVARCVAAWVEACQQQGVLACAKHFPGHGRTVEDSHTVLPRVRASRDTLRAELAPFEAAIRAGAASLMTAHVVYDAFDADRPATLSPAVITDLLRDELGYDGLVVTDALNMAGAVEAGGGEAGAALAALLAGCDALLYPSDLEAVIAHLRQAVAAGTLPLARVGTSIARIERAAAQVAASADAASPSDGAAAVGHDRGWAREVAVRCITEQRGVAAFAGAVDLIVIDDDRDGPHGAPERGMLAARLREHGIAVHETDAGRRSGRPLYVAVYADIRAWKGRSGLSGGSLRRIEEAVAGCPGATVLLFGHARLAAELTAARIVIAWGGEPLMQEAMADWMAARAAR